MRWSYSASKTFHQCQRRWYFQAIMSNSLPNAKDRLRREAFLSSQLQTVEAWRGSLVDQVIEKKVIIPLNQVGRISERDILNYASELFEKQLDFARRFRFRDDGMTKTKGDDAYLALFALEYGFDLDDDALEQAWSDIQTALHHLLNDDEIMDYLHQADYLLAQRKLYLKEDDFTVETVPDVIAFYDGHPPLIIDWKVHTEGNREAWLQLACYALALTQGDPHKDFASFDPTQYSPAEISLAEVQLLLPQTRWYSLTEDEVDAVEGYIHSSANTMLMALGDEENDVLRPLDFSTTQFPANCETCPFQKLCGAYHLWVS